MSRSGRILAVDPGGKRIGLAVSDESGTIARPLRVISHLSRKEDALEILRIAEEVGAKAVVVGVASGGEGEETPASRHAASLANEIRQAGRMPVILWDESESTQQARQVVRDLGLSRKRRSGHQDDRAAALILQSYLDSYTQDGVQ